MRWDERIPVAVRAGLLTVAFAAPLLAWHAHAARPALPPAAAIRAARADPALTRVAAVVRRAHVEVSAIDASLTRVSFMTGQRVAAEVAVRRDGQPVQSIDFAGMRVPYGNWIAYQPVLLTLLALLFGACTMVMPWRSLRNLDVLATLSLTVPVILLQQRLLGPSVLAALPGLLYLMARALYFGLGPPTLATGQPLLVALVPDAVLRRRVLRYVCASLAVIFVMVTVSSSDAVDVIYAVMEGATRLLHGVVPYGHMPGDVLHGDTYPLFSYLAYTPLAWVAPVTSTWSSVDLPLAFTAATAVGTAGLTARLARDWAQRRPQETHPDDTGARAATALLAFPPLLIIASTGTTDLLLGALLLCALALWRRPMLSAMLLAAAAGFKLVPLALVPIWLAGRRRLGGLWRAVFGLGLVGAALVLTLVALGGGSAMLEMARGISYQFSRGSPQSAWAQLHVSSLQPLGQALCLGLIVLVGVRVLRDPDLAADPQRIAALSAAVLIGVQLAANYWAFLYTVWFLPLLSVSLLGVTPVPAAQPVSARERARFTPVPATV